VNVPLLDLRAQFASIERDARAAMDRVLETQRFIGGPEVEALEHELAAYCGSRHAIGVSSGTDAILAALMAIGIGPGDEVIVPPFTFFATAGCVVRLGGKPVFADIEPRTFNIDPSKVERAVTKRTRAIMPVHLFGQCADLDPIGEIAARHGVAVIEDAAQAIGAAYKGRQAGSIGRIGCFSFFPSKNLGAFGDGGIVTTGDDELAAKLRVLRDHGQSPKYHYRFVGGNFRLDALQAAVLRVKLSHLEAWHEARRRNARRYDSHLADTAVTTPWIAPHNRAIYNQYVIRHPDRDGLKQHLSDRGVGTEVYYPVSLHLQECFADLGHREGDFPESERAQREVLAIPVYPELTEEQIGYVAECIAEFARR
jgi:dTDP-4-amino-4,6-dideoxygalactose transaminase